MKANALCTLLLLASASLPATGGTPLRPPLVFSPASQPLELPSPCNHYLQEGGQYR